jgi:hypothetical protein
MDNTGSCCSTAIAAPPRELWLYYSTNLQVDKNVDVLTPIWKRAAAAGYSKVLLTDSKFAKLGDLGEAAPRYLANAKKARLLAEELHLGLVPAVFSVGYSNSMLWHDPNLAEGQAPRRSLLEHGVLPPTSPSDRPVSLLVQPPWKTMLERSVREGKSDHWLAWYHLGVMRYRAGDYSDVRDAWKTSLSRQPSPWAIRDLAMLARDGGNTSQSASLLFQATRMLPTCAPLAIATASSLFAAGQTNELLAFTDSASAAAPSTPPRANKSARNSPPPPRFDFRLNVELV